MHNYRRVRSMQNDDSRENMKISFIKLAEKFKKNAVRP
jgi:hypothetical protein